MGTKQTIGNEKVLIGLRFQPRSQSSLLPLPYRLSRGRRENMGTRLLGFKLGFDPVFHFPVPRSPF